jgi:hypothetical protein
MILPPKAGLVWTKSVFSLTSKIVQSAVKPVLNLVEILGASDLPIEVAPIKIIVGFVLSTQSSNARA